MHDSYICMYDVDKPSDIICNIIGLDSVEYSTTVHVNL